MTRILLSGCCGKMGRVIADCLNEREDCEIIAGLDIVNDPLSLFTIFTSVEEINVVPDVIIDFSHPSVLDGLLGYAVKNKIPYVIATTGFSGEQINSIHLAAQEIPIFFSANMSIGVNLLTELAQRAAKIIGSSFDIEIIEMHHNRKIDAPSGTALMLAEAICSELPEDMKYEFDRHSKRVKRGKNEIGIHTIRGGTIVGEHEIIFAGRDEVIKLSHSAMSRDVFASGSVAAALFLKDKPSGLYSMKDLVDA